MKITAKELRNKWLKFYEERGHTNIGAVSLIGDGTTGVMFNVAGMQPLMPYLLGEKHPKGTRLCNVQGCVRTVDIEAVGDECHFTFFEMMGNWSLGDYFKKEKTAWSFEFLTKELGFDREKLCTTVFAGNNGVPKDEDAVRYLLDAGVKKENIYFLKDNWWDLPGTVNTPCGPDNEWFYPRHDNPCCDKCDVTCECGRWVEIGNDVYMQYKKLEDGKFEPLKNKNVDTGFGFERLLMYINGLTDGYKTDIFVPVINFIEKSSSKKYGEDENITRAMRVIADHIRTATMLIGDVNGIVPSNIGSGYILRRLLRRAIRFSNYLSLPVGALEEISKIYIEKIYADAYPLLVEKENYILNEIKKEQEKFEKTLEQGTREFNKLVENLKKFAPDNKKISGDKAFRLFDTFGFPLELTQEMADEIGFMVDKEGFEKAFEKHQEASKSLDKGAAKGGLADDSEATVKLHTACHLLLAGLRKLLGEQVEQKGSNITSERLRFDFNYDDKLSDEQIKWLEDFVNNAIERKIAVERLEMPFVDAIANGGYGVHKADQNENVSVYKIGDIDFQICGGPHVKNTADIGKFKIVKEQSSSAGIRRIRAEIGD